MYLMYIFLIYRYICFLHIYVYIYIFFCDPLKTGNLFGIEFFIPLCVCVIHRTHRETHLGRAAPPHYDGSAANVARCVAQWRLLFALLAAPEPQRSEV